MPSSFPFSYSFFENIIDLSNMNTWRVLPPSFVKCFKELFLTSQTVNVSCSSNFPWSSKLPLRKTILFKWIRIIIIKKFSEEIFQIITVIMKEMKRLVSLVQFHFCVVFTLIGYSAYHLDIWFLAELFQKSYFEYAFSLKFVKSLWKVAILVKNLTKWLADLVSCFACNTKMIIATSSLPCLSMTNYCNKI